MGAYGSIFSGEIQVQPVLERRRMQYLVATMPPPPGLAGLVPVQSVLSGDANGALQKATPSADQGVAAVLGSLILPRTPGPVDDFGALLSLAEHLLRSRQPAARRFSGLLYDLLFRCYSDQQSRERMLRGLVGQAATSVVAPSLPVAASRSTPPPSPGGGKRGARRARQAAAAAVAVAAALPATAAKPSSAGASSSGSASAGSPAGAGGPADGGGGAPDGPQGLLSYLLYQHGNCAAPAVAFALEAARAEHAQGRALQEKLAAADEATAAAKRAAAEAAERARERSRAAATRVAELEAELARSESERRAEVASARSGTKELQAKMRNLESQAEWLKAEKEEAVAAAGGDSAALSAKLEEAEAALTRTKALRTSDLKRVNREKSQLQDHVKVSFRHCLGDSLLGRKRREMIEMK